MHLDALSGAAFLKSRHGCLGNSSSSNMATAPKTPNVAACHAQLLRSRLIGMWLFWHWSAYWRTAQPPRSLWRKARRLLDWPGGCNFGAQNLQRSSWEFYKVKNNEAQIQISISLHYSCKCGNRFSKSRVKPPVFSTELIAKSARWQNFACPSITNAIWPRNYLLPFFFSPPNAKIKQIRA
jgi:hypothetical protein